MSPGLLGFLQWIVSECCHMDRKYYVRRKTALTLKSEIDVASSLINQREMILQHIELTVIVTLLKITRKSYVGCGVCGHCATRHFLPHFKLSSDQKLR